ncbi:hypothetical protein AWB67_03999 [Caballeronia terrestris]|uniref:Uncharacterized protein n=1 Tax=Caballeronia terrestris TaxID=1226301 RepID=A0A158JLS3_9BURK|nr:hypothetical protein [Caballeronia terrestris]SAL69826.1 hypothetical protein AWB67_03999 [Caballeronia terrestris]
MALSVEKLRVLAFPQRIAGAQFDLNVLLLPTQRLLNLLAPFPSALDPGTTIELPKFIAGTLELEVDVIRGLASYPFSDATVLAADGASIESFATGASFPANLPVLYEGLASQFKLVNKNSVRNTEGAPVPSGDANAIRKYLPQSYRQAFNFTNPRTQFAKTDDSYHCAIRGTKRDPAFPPPVNDVTWGRVIAFCLRQPLLAERIGLLHRIELDLPDVNYFADGGWVSCRLASTLADFDIVDAATELRSYAARIPPIATPRPLFAAVQFPVVAGPAQPGGDFDTLKIEASDYDDGFAKVVHVTQPVSSNLLSEAPDGIHVQKDIGVRLAWDDEQILIWQNRQMLADPATPAKRIDAPLGAYSYRVDVREAGGANWRSLVRIRSKASLVLAGATIAGAETLLETGVQVFPSKVNADIDTALWLPAYFTQWYGASLVLPDDKAAQLDASGALSDPGAYGDANIQPSPGQSGGLYEPILPDDCELKYGHAYDFRVRLADLTGGGPREDDEALNDAPATSASLVFRRYVAPKQLTVTPSTPQPGTSAGSVQFYTGDAFTIARPRLGYPALLFTELDTGDAFQHLLDDRDALHANKPPGQTINEYRGVGYFDPDVDRVLVLVDVKTLQLDNEASASQREPFIPLYATLRDFPEEPADPFDLALQYRNANVIDFGNEIDLGDLGLSKQDIDRMDALVLPTSRDIRITVYPVCSDKAALPEYFGFGKTRVGDETFRVGEPTQFYVREDAADELAFFANGLESRELQGIYLKPDPPQVNNRETLVAATVEGSEASQSTLIGRLAAQMRVDFKGLTLIGQPGERVQFGCSHRIRHTLAPDNSSLTFATRDELIDHWLCVLSFDVARDWTWDGMAHEGIEIACTRLFTGEAATRTNSIAGYVTLSGTASRTATTNPDRSHTRIVFVDAVEPKKDRSNPATAAQRFPNTIDVSYTLTPRFSASVNAEAAKREAQTRDVRLPVTVIPAQVPTVVGAGYALSPYQRDHDYAQTAVRERYLWLEFDAPIDDPNDGLFARVLAYAPDPLLSFPNPDQVLVRQDDPPLAIDPELIRVITHGQSDDNAGIDAMQPMLAETADPSAQAVKITPTHYLLPLPPGLHAESPELSGFFTYELRVGHTGRIWCTAQGRFGHPTRLSGVQHPAPPLKVLLERTPGGVTVTAPYSVAVFGGRNVTSRPPKTEIWCMLYAQVTQADATSKRNILLAEARLDLVQQKTPGVRAFLAERPGMPIRTFNSLAANLDAPATGTFTWTETEIRQLLDAFRLLPDASLSVLAVEMMPRYDQFIAQGEPPDTSVRPLSRELGQYRILRTSVLVAAPGVCCENC